MLFVYLFLIKIMKKIIYNTKNGLAIITPTDESIANHTIEEIAKKDVPDGIPYKIIDSSEVPEDRTFRDAWEYNIVIPDGYGSNKSTF